MTTSSASGPGRRSRHEPRRVNVVAEGLVALCALCALVGGLAVGMTLVLMRVASILFG
jgi:hypothetical protein